MNMWILALFYCIAIVAIIIILIFMLLKVITSPYPSLRRYDSEKVFIDLADGGKQKPFPSLNDAASIDLSVIVPAYNEEDRLPVMLNEAMEYFQERTKRHPFFTYEIIIVDDGSRDKTTKTGLLYSKRYNSNVVRVLTLARNRGKGGAIRMGMLSARGRILLFADADGATLFSDLDKLEDGLNQLVESYDNPAIVCGSRAHLQSDSVVQRSMFRTFLMYGFHFLVWFLCVRNVKDTQCGFKLLTQPAARILFRNLHVERWAFDVDLLYLTNHFGIPVAEVPVSWEEVEGSKLVPVFSWLQMGKDLLLIRLRYYLGVWKISPKDKEA